MSFLDIRIDIDSDELGMFFGILIGLGVVSWIVLCMLKNKRDRENAAQPIERMEAVIVEKQQIGADQIAFEQWIMFETVDGRRMRLICRSNNTYMIGDRGTLNWQGSRLISFETRNGRPSDSGCGGQTSSYQEKIPAWKQVEMENNNK